jgi:large subunit ribosomal protein L15
MKGQKSRAGSFSKAGFEGGQTPLYMRLPKGRGAKQRFAPQVTKPDAISVRHLSVFESGTIVGLGQLKEKQLISWRTKTVKIIGGGSLERKLTVRTHAVTAQARVAIEEAGGKVEIIHD